MNEPQCPLCGSVSGSDNIKICPEHQEELLKTIENGKSI